MKKSPVSPDGFMMLWSWSSVRTAPTTTAKLTRMSPTNLAMLLKDLTDNLTTCYHTHKGVPVWNPGQKARVRVLLKGDLVLLCIRNVEGDDNSGTDQPPVSEPEGA